ncbi:MAG TPA: lysine--tRNA ligase [Candidatus Aminicenantes bacterium]|nr:lysine--tRNA ligase [Candidatus Aminicenantes bacterium]
MEEQFTIRKEKLKKLSALGLDPWPYAFDRSHTFAQVTEVYAEADNQALEALDGDFRLAGRVVALRRMGKSVFAHLFDGEIRLQVYLRQDKLSETDFEVVRLLDMGDIVGVSGSLFRTRTGELTVLVSRLVPLAKAFHPLPEKWHGLQDKELRYRRRYLDLIVNEESRRIFRMRSEILREIRLFFYQEGYLEVETPMMHPIPGGASARPFVTHHNALDMDLYLRVAPELYLKRLLVGGMEKVFEMNRNFRNEGISMRHNPEFTMLEFYQLYKDYEDNMRLTEKLLARLCERFVDGAVLRWRDLELPLQPPFPRRRYMDLLAERTGLSSEDVWDKEALAGFLRRELPDQELPPTWEKMLESAFDTWVEPGLSGPVFVVDFPRAISPLAKVSRRDPRETERFELYIASMEIANGFSELNDPFDQRERFEAQLKQREQGDDEAQWLDEEFLLALEHGMAPATGEGIGIDRLVMLLTGAESIREVVLFPQLRTRS